MNREHFHARPVLLLPLAVLVFAVVAMACSSTPSSTGPDSAAAVTPVEEGEGHEVSETATPEPDEHETMDMETPEAGGEGHEAASGPNQVGQLLFVEKGCVVCHGENAAGTDVAPGLSGHSGAMVKRQVRAPVGMMPVFPPDKVSNAEMDSIAAYIEGISGGHTHQRAKDVGQEVAQHHWMALFALADNSISEAIHHVDHIMEIVTGEHLAGMRRVKQNLSDENTHDATHAIEEMLAGTAVAELSGETMHLSLALSSIRVDEIEDAEHHLEHFVALADSHDVEKGREILGLIRVGAVGEAKHELEEALGAPADEDHEAEGGDGHDDAEGAEGGDGHDDAEGAEGGDGHDDAEGAEDDHEHDEAEEAEGDERNDKGAE